MSHNRSVRLVAFILVIGLATVPLFDNGVHSGALLESPMLSSPFGGLDDISTNAADPGVQTQHGSLLIMELTGSSIPSHGIIWSQLLSSYGIPNTVCTTDEVELDPSMLSYSSGVLIDASLGSDNGLHVSDILIQHIIAVDLPTILSGRAAWILHLLRERGPPSQTAPSTTSLLTTPGLEGAVYLTNPMPLTIGAALTAESPVPLPDDQVQSERSRLIDLTGRESQTHLASLRYESWPLDLFLFSPEDPSQLTTEGLGLLVNTIAYSRALRENSITQELGLLQADSTSTLPGGFSYAHEPTMQATYYAVHAMKSLLASAEWETWKNTRSTKVQAILQTLLVDYGSESAFMTSTIDTVVNLKTTAQGLWLISAMSLNGLFPISEIASYLGSRQDVSGHFENHITTSYYVTEALSQSGNLASINVVTLESWLRSCVIDGSKTSNPDLWGAIAADPSSISPSNEFAAHYTMALGYLGTDHNDPLKLSQWIATRTSNGDGSFNNSLNLSEDIVIGTGSAAIALASLDTLTPENSSSITNWFASNQLESGGYGLKEIDGDIVAKSEESYVVAKALEVMDEYDHPIADALSEYFGLVETDIGFEIMEPIPTLMWSYWISLMSRQNHALGTTSLFNPESYLDCFSQLSQYPFWNNLTAYTAPEYGVNQYRSKSVWSQFFGISLAHEVGADLSSSVISDAVSYILQSQYVLGHFRPALFSGTAQMQHTVAAVEALYLVDALDSIYYKSSLESAILSEYDGGAWSATGWSLRPFAGQQSAIDWLSTRAAVRLGLIDASMAQEIAAQIRARTQYTDLWSLSCDVATLALLNASGFGVDLESFDISQIRVSLGSPPFQNGWFNSTLPYQPVFSASVLEMISVLGLRVPLYENLGSSLAASSASICELGSDISIEVSISSSPSSHEVLVYAFDEWIHFNNVFDSDVLILSTAEDIEFLGPQDIYLQVDDWGISKSFARVQLTVIGVLQGELSIDASLVTTGELINGSATWTLSSGLDAGYCNISVRLGNPPNYEQWNYVSSAPFGISIPTADFESGMYNLTVTITREFCQALILESQVLLVSPEPTHLQATQLLSAMVDEAFAIPWSLRIVSNDSELEDQLVELTIIGEDDQILYTASELSKVGDNNFIWTPLEYGNLSYSLSFGGNGSLTPCEFNGAIEVYESTAMVWSGMGIWNQYSAAMFEGQLLTTGGEPIAGENVHITIVSPTSTVILDTTYATNSSGHISLVLTLSDNGNYSIEWIFAESGFLLGSSGIETVASWSSSHLQVGGISAEVLVGTSWDIFARLSDSMSNPVVGQPVTLRVILLPSTVIYEQSIITNISGFAVLHWIPSSAGSYHLEASYFGSSSRGAADDMLPFEVRIPIVLVISHGEDLEVGIGNWIQVTATDHASVLVSGLYVSVAIIDPTGEILFSESGVTVNGAIYFSWIPSIRGLNNITATSARQGYYEAAFEEDSVGVMEVPEIAINVSSNLLAPSLDSVIIVVHDKSGLPISGVSIQITVLLNANILTDITDVTDSEGEVFILLDISEPGALTIDVVLYEQGWLLSASAHGVNTVTGETDLILTTPGQPVVQGTPIAILATLTAWDGQPLTGAQVSFRILWANGSLVASTSRITGENGICTMAFDFNMVGDFIINATYVGQQLNATATASAPQRVYVTPTIEILHSPSCLLGENLQIQLGLLDSFGNRIPGRTLLVEITINSIMVFEAQVQTESDLVSINWSPTERGLALIEILHAGDVHYYTNISQSSTSVLEQVSGTLALSPSVVDLFDSALLTYTLSATQLDGVSITLEVLGVDLVPLWSTIVETNGSGIADAIYMASHAHGILMVRARIEASQFLIGGDVQAQLNVMSDCNVSLSLEPQPPCAGQPANITIFILDELGLPLNGLSVSVSLFDPMGEQVKLGTFTKSVTISSVNGMVRVPFTPSMTGLYTISATCSGAVSIHPFMASGLHTVYSPTNIIISLLQSEIEVGDTITIGLFLVDYSGSPMIGRNITMLLDGPGPAAIGPVELVTNASGYADFSTAIGVEGIWVFEAAFGGLGVYLPSSTSDQVNVRYGTTIETSIVNGLSVAGQSSIILTVLLADSGGTPLEGFTIRYQAYHDLYGLWDEGSVIQQGQEPMELELSLDRMGNYTILLSFDGTTHYHPSMAAESVQVMGTTAISFDGPTSIDRADASSLIITILDEVFNTIAIDELAISLEMIGPSGEINLVTRVSYLEYELQVALGELPIGQYSVNIVIDDLGMRIGTTDSFVVHIKSETSLQIIEEHISGLLSQSHSLRFVLEDSLHELVSSEVAYVSIYNPEGREIYGSPLTERTALQVTTSGTQVSWTPTLVGEYRIVLAFDGTTYLNSSSYERNVVIRYISIIDVSIAERVQYGDSVAVSLSLTGGITKLQNMELIIIVSLDGTAQQQFSVTTGGFGRADFTITGLFSGNHSVSVVFNGTDSYAPAIVTKHVVVEPTIIYNVERINSLYVGADCSVNLTVTIMGVRNDWQGTLDIILLSPDGTLLGTSSFPAFQRTYRVIEFNAPEAGSYYLNITTSGLPVLGTENHLLPLTVESAPLIMELDAGTAPVVGGVGILVVIGVVFWRRLDGVLGVMPTDWTG